MLYYPDMTWVEEEERYEYYRDGTGLVLDFGPNQRYVDESHCILNARASLEWADWLYYPMKIDAMGTIIQYESLHETVGIIGCHFLQVPFLQPGDYTVTVYRCNMDEQLSHYYFNTIQKKWVWKTEFEYEHDYSFTESASYTFTVEETNVAANVDEIIELLKTVNASITDVVLDAEGRLQVEVDNILDIVNTIDGNVVYIKGKADGIALTVESIEDDTMVISWDDVLFIKGKVEPLVPTADVELMVDIVAVLSAIAAIAGVTAVVVVIRRLRVAG